MIRLFTILGTALTSALAASLCATVVAAQTATTDISTLDKETAEKAFPTKPPYAGRNFPRDYISATPTRRFRWTQAPSRMASSSTRGQCDQINVGATS